MRERVMGDGALTSSSWKRDVVVMVTLYVAGLVVLVHAARSLGVAAGESAWLDAATHAREAFTRSSGSGGSAWQALADAGPGRPTALFPIVVGGWAASRFAGPGGLDAILALRLGAALVAALTPPLVFALVRHALGLPLSVLAAVLSLAVPRGVVDQVTLSGDGVTATFVLGCVVAYVQSVRMRSAVWAALSAASLGLGMACSLSAVLVVPILLLHQWLSRPALASRLASRGLAPLPLALALAPLVSLAVFVAAQPSLWKGTGEGVAALLVAACSPHIGAGTWLGSAPMPDTIPRGHALAMLFLALPTSTSVLAIVGAFAASRSRPGPLDRPGTVDLPLLLLVALAVLLGWPLIAPPALGQFPGRFGLAVPFAAALAALGAGVVARALAHRFPTPYVLAFCAVLPSAGLFGAAATYASSFPLVAGGAMRAASSHRVPLHDGTPAGGLAAAIDALGAPRLRLYAPSVPIDAWSTMHRLGRLKTQIEVVNVPASADALVLSGTEVVQGARVVASLRRDGQTVISLARR